MDIARNKTFTIDFGHGPERCRILQWCGRFAFVHCWVKGKKATTCYAAYRDVNDIAKALPGVRIHFSSLVTFTNGAHE